MGVFLLLMGTVSLLESMCRCVGVIFHVICIGLGISAVDILDVICWGSSAIMLQTRRGEVKDSLELVWKASDKESMCEIEKEFD